MLFSLYGLVQLAQDENEANDQIQKNRSSFIMR